MRICTIYDADYPWDVRVEKVLATLVESGYEAHLVCRNLSKRRLYERVDGFHIHRLPYIPFNALNHVFSFPVFCHPVWLWKILGVVKKNRIDVIIVRDLPLAAAAIVVGRLCVVPVVFDMAEDYPAMIRDMWKFDGFKLANLCLRNPWAVERVEAACIRRVDSIVTVVEESKRRLLDQYHLEEADVYIVSNTPRLAQLPAVQPRHEVEETRGTTNLIYLGGLQAVRSLDVVLRGIALSKGEHDCHLTIVGNGGVEKRLRALVDALHMRGRVVFKGWIEHSEIGEVLQSSDIGIVPHSATPHTNTTVPNKLFDYMAYAKPVLASDTLPVQRIVEAESCGLVYRYDSPEDFSAKLGQLMDLRVRTRMGLKGRRAVENKYNWDKHSRSLRQAITRAHSRDRSK